MKDDDIVKDYTKDLRKESEKHAGERKEILNRRRNIVIPRKYHMTPGQMEKLKKRFDDRVKDVSKEVKEAAGSKFFNPFRQAGIYHGCVQSLYLLKANEWHEYINVYNQISRIMEAILDVKQVSSWTRFCNKSPRKVGIQEILTAKDEEGRIKQNFRVLQRLGGIHPYGYKLMQVCACIDVKRNKEGKFFFRLNTSFKDPSMVKPDYECKYKKPRDRSKKVVVQSSELADKIVVGVMDDE